MMANVAISLSCTILEKNGRFIRIRTEGNSQGLKSMKLGPEIRFTGPSLSFCKQCTIATGKETLSVELCQEIQGMSFLDSIDTLG